MRDCSSTHFLHQIKTSILTIHIKRSCKNYLTFHVSNFYPDGDPIKLPENLETLPRAEHFPTQRHRWNTNEVSDLTCEYKVGKFAFVRSIRVINHYIIRSYILRYWYELGNSLSHFIHCFVPSIESLLFTFVGKRRGQKCTWIFG